MAGGPRGAGIQHATVVIVGVGLLGGSLGLALEGRCARRVGVVAEGDAGTAATALEIGAVDVVADLASAVGEADLVILAMPVREIVALLPRVAGLLRPGAVLSDLGSTKVEVVGAMAALPPDVAAVGGHPMCGGTANGVEHARRSLFEGAAWATCPVPGRAESAAHAGAVVASMASAVGAAPVDLDAADHDRAVAHVSHLPYAIAQALMQLAVARSPGLPAVETLAATGFAGATRMAAGDPRMWRDILRTNRGPVLDAIDGLTAQLRDLVEVMADDDRLLAWLERGAAAHRDHCRP